jgi:hypothetical protein
MIACSLEVGKSLLIHFQQLQPHSFRERSEGPYPCKYALTWCFCAHFHWAHKILNACNMPSSWVSRYPAIPLSYSPLPKRIVYDKVDWPSPS